MIDGRRTPVQRVRQVDLGVKLKMGQLLVVGGLVQRSVKRRNGKRVSETTESIYLASPTLVDSRATLGVRPATQDPPESKKK